MKKNDLENGMIVETRKGLRFLILGENLIGDDLCNALNSYDEQMNDKLFDDSDYDIIKVYKFNGKVILSEIFEDKNLKLIWEKERELDWSKVPEWTKVQVKFPGEVEWENYLFTNYLPNNVFKFLVAGFKDDEFTGYEATRHQVEYCKIHPSVKIKDEWYK